MKCPNLTWSTVAKYRTLLNHVSKQALDGTQCKIVLYLSKLSFPCSRYNCKNLFFSRKLLLTFVVNSKINNMYKMLIWIELRTRKYYVLWSYYAFKTWKLVNEKKMMFWFCYYEASLTCNIIIVAAKKLTLIYFKGLKTVIKNQAWRLCEFFRTRQPLKNRGFQGHVHDVPLSSHFARSTVAK